MSTAERFIEASSDGRHSADGDSKMTQYRRIAVLDTDGNSKEVVLTCVSHHVDHGLRGPSIVPPPCSSRSLEILPFSVMNVRRNDGSNAAPNCRLPTCTSGNFPCPCPSACVISCPFSTMMWITNFPPLGVARS